MKHLNFWMKLVSLLVICGVLGFYQTIALSRAAEVEQNEAAVAEAEAYNAEILAELSEEEEQAAYADGVYEGEGSGFGGTITVSVTIAGGELTDITVLSAEGEDAAYFQQAESVLAEMLAAQSAEVDTVSGATFSSGGLIAAVADALGKAVN